MSTLRIAVIGLGDVGTKIATSLAQTVLPIELLIVGRCEQRAKQVCALASACGSRQVKFRKLDALCSRELSNFINDEQPSLIIQAACMISPWAAFSSQDRDVLAFKNAGFGANLCAQLPIIMRLMSIVRSEHPECFVVNCSYPDVTGPILKNLDIQPDIGIGNSGMILKALRAQEKFKDSHLRVFAHHSQVWPFITGNNGITAPKIKLFDGDDDISMLLGQEATDIPITKDLNILAAAHAVDLIEALLTKSFEHFGSAPAPLGLPGGWPVRISDGRVELDLPKTVSVADGIRFQEQASKAEGIAKICKDGSVEFTQELQNALPQGIKHIAEPLKPEQAESRSRDLMDFLAEKGCIEV